MIIADDAAEPLPDPLVRHDPPPPPTTTTPAATNPALPTAPPPPTPPATTPRTPRRATTPRTPCPASPPPNPRPASPPPTPRPTLLDLPHSVLALVAAKAGRHRLTPLCTALDTALAAALPLPSLRPDRPLPPPALASALAAISRRHAPTLTALDLTHTAHHLRFPHLRYLAPAALPNLLSLTLSDPHRLGPPTLVALLPLPTLTHLSITSPRPTWALDPFTVPPLCALAPRLRSLTFPLREGIPTGCLPDTTTPAFHALAALSALTSLTHLHLTHANPDADPCWGRNSASVLLTATGRLPALRSLILQGIPLAPLRTTTALLAAHTALTRLGLCVRAGGNTTTGGGISRPRWRPENDAPAAEVLAAVGALGARLESLAFHLCMAAGGSGGRTPVHRDAVEAALERLTGLRCLRLRGLPVDIRWAEALWGTQLTELQLEPVPGYRHGEFDGSVGGCLGQLLPLAGSLRVLELQHVDAQVGVLGAVSALTALTALSLSGLCAEGTAEWEWGREGAGGGWGMADLRAALPGGAAGVGGGGAGGTLAPPSLSTLRDLRSLTLLDDVGDCLLRDPRLARHVLGALTGLTRLQLSGNVPHAADALLATDGGCVTGMRALEVLALCSPSGHVHETGCGASAALLEVAVTALPRLKDLWLPEAWREAALWQVLAGAGKLPRKLCRVWVGRPYRGEAAQVGELERVLRPAGVAVMHGSRC